LNQKIQVRSLAPEILLFRFHGYKNTEDDNGTVCQGIPAKMRLWLSNLIIFERSVTMTIWIVLGAVVLGSIFMIAVWCILAMGKKSDEDSVRIYSEMVEKKDE
jgi:hypothetical protein